MKSVVMAGPCPDAKGGMASVVSVYRANGLFTAGDCVYLTTAVEGSGVKKLLFAVQAIVRFSTMLFRGRVALLHVHGASHTSFWRKQVLMYLARLFLVPVIFHLHGGEFRQFVDERTGPRTRRHVIDSLGSCKLIYCLNEEIRDWLQTLVPNVPVRVLPNPIDLRFSVQNMDPRKPRILYLGRLEREKGVFDLVEAFASMAHRIPHCQLILCGSGSAKRELEKCAARKGVSTQVTFPGWVDGDAKATLLSQAGVFVLPSYAEGMPMSVLESMAAHTPIVATRVGAIADMLESGASGFVVEPGDIGMLTNAILLALTNTETTDAMTRRARARVQSCYAAEVVLSQLRKTYTKLSA